MDKFICQYTHQKTKKKKTWYDGEIIVYKSHMKCVLYSDQSSKCKGKILDSKFLSKDEIQRILKQEVDELEFDGYLVQIEFANITYQAPNMLAVKRSLPDDFPKFKVPSTIISSKPQVESIDTSEGASVPAVSGVYTITDGELDEIWCLGNSKRQKCDLEHVDRLLIEEPEVNPLGNSDVKDKTKCFISHSEEDFDMWA